MSDATDECLVTDVTGPDTQRPEHPTFVLIHGLGVSSWYFEPLKEALAEHARVVTLDLPGFGHAPQPDEPLSIAGLARSVIDTIDEMGLDDVVLVGHSMGTQVAVETLIARPDIAGAAVLITPVVTPEQRSVPRVIVSFARSSMFETVRTIYRSALTFISTDPNWIAPHFRAMVDYALEDRIGLVRADIPILIIGADHDRMCPRPFLHLLHSRAQATRAGGITRTREIVNAAHAVITSHAKEITRACLEMGKIRR